MTGGDRGESQKVARELRKKAALARRAASVPTSGSARVDRVLVLLAERLEREASVLEQEQGLAQTKSGNFAAADPTP